MSQQWPPTVVLAPWPDPSSYQEHGSEYRVVRLINTARPVVGTYLEEREVLEMCHSGSINVEIIRDSG
jgi:hypothetical protein